eukprot:9404929-Lingulodinium_polyedra.AAC.1
MVGRHALAPRTQAVNGLCFAAGAEMPICRSSSTASAFWLTNYSARPACSAHQQASVSVHCQRLAP